MPQPTQFLPQLMRYKKSIILLSAGLGVGVTFTLLVQCLSGGSKEQPPQQQAAAPSSGMRIAGRVDTPPPAPAAAPAPFVPVTPMNNPFVPQAAPPQQVSGYAPAPSSGYANYGSPTPQTSPQGYNSGPAPIGTMDYSQSRNGYPIAVGRRAVDSFVPGGGVLPAIESDGGGNVIIDPTQSSNTMIDPTPGLDTSQMTVGRNGLLGNPCSDPASCRGRAYSTGSAQ